VGGARAEDGNTITKLQTPKNVQGGLSNQGQWPQVCDPRVVGGRSQAAKQYGRTGGYSPVL